MLTLLSLTIGYQQYKETNMNFRFTTTSLGLMLCATASAVQFGAGVDYAFNKVEIKDADFGRFADTHKVTSNPFNIYAQLSHNVKIDKKSTLDLQAEVRKSLDKDLDVYKNQIKLKQDFSFGVNLRPTYKINGSSSAFINAGVHFAPIKYTDTYRNTKTEATIMGPKFGVGLSHKLNKNIAATAQYAVFMPLKETIKASDKGDRIDIMHQSIGAGIQFIV